MWVQAVARSFCFRASFDFTYGRQELSSRYSFKEEDLIFMMSSDVLRTMESRGVLTVPVRAVPCVFAIPEKPEAKNTKDAECDGIVRLISSFSSLGICASKANRNKY